MLGELEGWTESNYKDISPHSDLVMEPGIFLAWRDLQMDAHPKGLYVSLSLLKERLLSWLMASRNANGNDKNILSFVKEDEDRATEWLNGTLLGVVFYMIIISRWLAIAMIMFKDLFLDVCYVLLIQLGVQKEYHVPLSLVCRSEEKQCHKPQCTFRI